MQNNRDMFYSDYQASGFVSPTNINPSFVPNNMMPNVNAYSMQSFNSSSPMSNNIAPVPMMQNPMMDSGAYSTINNTNTNTNTNFYENSNYMENRVLKLERQVKRLESRVTRLENLSGNSLEDTISTTTDMYMI